MRLIGCAMALWLLAAVAPVRAQQAPAAALASPLPPALQLAPGMQSVRLAGVSRWWITTDRHRTAEQVEAEAATLPWQLRTAREQHQLDDRVLWLNFSAAVAPGTRWFLMINSTGLDNAQLHHRDPLTGQWVVQRAGDRVPQAQWSVPGRIPTFELAGPVADGVPVQYWLRVENRRFTFGAPMGVYEERALLNVRDREQFLLGGYYGMALLLIGSALVIGTVWRERNFIAFAAYVAVMCLGQAGMLGVGAQHLWPGSLRIGELAALLLPGVAAAVGLWFVMVVSEPQRSSRALALACWALVALMLAAVALDAAHGSPHSFVLVLGLTLLAMVLSVALLVIAWRRDADPFAALVALANLPLLLSAMLPLARAFNLVPTTNLTRYGLSLGVALQLPLLFYALTKRAVRRRGARLREADLPRTDALTGLANRATLLAQLQPALERAQARRERCALLLVRLTNHDALATDYGAEFGERALVVAAAVVRDAATDNDTAARTGPHDFALLLAPPAAGGVALSRAQQIVARGLQHSRVLPPGVELKFHVAVALLPEHTLGAAQAVAWLEQTCEAMRADPRRAIRALNL